MNSTPCILGAAVFGERCFCLLARGDLQTNIVADAARVQMRFCGSLLVRLRFRRGMCVKGCLNIIINSLTQISKIKKIDDCFYTALGLLGVARAELEQVQ